MRNFLFVAAENDALSNCKAGGMADVVRDVPRQIAAHGDQVHVIVPAYSRLHQGGEFLQNIGFGLRDVHYEAQLYRVAPKKEFDNISHYVIHHPEIQAGGIGHMYHHDAEEPYFTDTIKFFIFCTAVAQSIINNAFGRLDVVHLHDWHTSPLLFLKTFHHSFTGLSDISFVYTIHNLSIQGIRPFEHNYSSLVTWFPKIPFDWEGLRDDRYPDCINLMAWGIRYADKVHTVSPSYKEDILLPSRPPEFIGGEGLEEDLNKANDAGRLYGILNGVNYKNFREAERGRLYPNILKSIFKWLQEESKKYKADFLAHTGEKVVALMDHKPAFICSSVARLTDQKFYFFKRNPDLLAALLEKLREVNGVFMLLGTGAPEYEELMRRLSYEYGNFVFINGQSEDVIDSIYLETDLYFMPSLFEPCGISQMLAMRNGVPCLVHRTGGLKDTVNHKETGFTFGGDTYLSTLQDMLVVFDEVLEIFQNDQETWKNISKNAKNARFSWKDAVNKYYEKLYD